VDPACREAQLPAQGKGSGVADLGAPLDCEAGGKGLVGRN
jgi:hypothetical protein